MIAMGSARQLQNQELQSQTQIDLKNTHQILHWSCLGWVTRAAAEADDSKPVSSLEKVEPPFEKPKEKKKAKAKAKDKADIKKSLPPPKPKAATKKKTLPPPKPKAAPKPKDDDKSEDEPPPVKVRKPAMKRPAACSQREAAPDAAPKMKATKYMYHATQKWGIKLNGREQLTVRAFNKAVFSIGFGVVFFFWKVFTCFLLGFILLLDSARFWSSIDFPPGR